MVRKDLGQVCRTFKSVRRTVLLVNLIVCPCQSVLSKWNANASKTIPYGGFGVYAWFGFCVITVIRDVPSTVEFSEVVFLSRGHLW